MPRIAQTQVNTTESDRVSREKDGIKASLLWALSSLSVQRHRKAFLSDIHPIRSGSAGETSADRDSGALHQFRDDRDAAGESSCMVHRVQADLITHGSGSSHSPALTGQLRSSISIRIFSGPRTKAIFRPGRATFGSRVNRTPRRFNSAHAASRSSTRSPKWSRPR